MTYELWQTEWCPASRRVRQRLTELGIGRRKNGNFSYYRVVDDGIWRLCHDVCGSVERNLGELRELFGG